ncbi:nuclear RNA binding protein [Histoplasma capsulatum H143]|uniref:Nuclear RNA binding protein n=1 Tax=Ajellomyces capsulatus (strain H143) TaxID=544712 RepID=C6HIK4_AJECH|nr:nuclear RNA binding protein [Histoplasma capsulatum H143]
MGKEKTHQSRPSKINTYTELKHGQIPQMIAPQGGRHGNEQIDQHHHYSTPTHRHVERQLGSACEATSPDAASGSVGRNSSAKRKLFNANDDQSPGYDYDYDRDDPLKGSLLAALRAAENNDGANPLEFPSPQYGNDISKSLPKRMRSNEWFLKRREVNVSPSQAHASGKKESVNSRLRSRRRSSYVKSHSVHRSVSTSAPAAAAAAAANAEGGRKSRFLEGSMNDRVSQKPPSIYIGEDIGEAVDRYMTGDDEDGASGSVSSPGKRPGYGHSYTSSTATSMSSVPTDAPSAKQSGLSRFGQVIASAFNPFGVWNNVSEIWNGSQDGTKTSTTSASTRAATHKDILAERQAQAEKAYAELKVAGYQGTVKSTSASYRAHPTPEKNSVKKKSKHPYLAGRTPQQQHKPIRSTSSTFSKDNLLSPSKSAFRASFLDLRKAASNISLPLTPKRTDAAGEDNNHNNDDNEDGNSRVLREKVSRRHLEKQRKLRKKKFVPGALPSLPSERILLGQDVEKPPNKAVFAGATPNGPRLLNAEDASTPSHKLRKTRREKNLTPATSSRHASMSTGALDIHREEHRNNDAVPYSEEDYARTPPFDSLSVSKRNQPGRKQGLTDDNQPPSNAQPIPKPNHPPRRRRSPTTFPSQNHIRDHTSDIPTNSTAGSSIKCPQPRRSGSGAAMRNDHQDDDGDDDIPPVPPLPANFIAMSGASVRSRGQLEVQQKEQVCAQNQQQQKKQQQKPQEFDWPEDFL